MLRAERRKSGWQGACLVAITYVYFLIFAQFAFITRLASLGLAGAHLKVLMAAMAFGGVLLSLLTPRLRVMPPADLRLRIGFGISGAAAFLSLLPLGLAEAMSVSFLIGAGLGLVTVTVATYLRRWAGTRNPLLMVGLGTGIGYLICNLPPFFTAPAEVQAVVAGLLCLAGVGITLVPALERFHRSCMGIVGSHPSRKNKDAARMGHPGPYTNSEAAPALREEAEVPAQSAIPFVQVLAGFAALVWLDSAAFFIIQNTPELKAGTWAGSVHIGVNGLLHLSAAVAAAWFLRRRGLWFVLSAAFAALGGACLLLLNPERALLASIFYPIGVSLYSVALVAYPSLLAPATSDAERGRSAGWIYAVAGWAGSAMGIGMGQNLGYVPPVFVLAAGAVILLPWLVKLVLKRRREVGITAAVMLLAFCLDRTLVKGGSPVQLSQIERGRRVYISEGCIHCHSQYVRPNSPDVQLWGPVKTMGELRLEHPPLIGNRRQGPDLSQVGGRRSPMWLKAHFYDPPEVSGASIMPAYAFLFRDHRGEDLVAYLASLHGLGTAKHIAQERLWRPSGGALRGADAAQGEQLFHRDCATCHSTDGHTRSGWAANFKRLPPDLSVGPYFYVSPSGPEEERMICLAQITRFGVPGTDMPGHEYMPDSEIASISKWLSRVIAQSNQKPQEPIPHRREP